MADIIQESHRQFYHDFFYIREIQLSFIIQTGKQTIFSFLGNYIAD